MGYNIKFNEWQEKSLKKDVEKIVSILSQKRTLETSVLWEAFFALLAMVLDHTNFISAFPISAALLIIAAFSPLVIIVILMLNLRRKRTIEYKTLSRSKSKFVDDFDNRVCYWVMTASSFCDALSGKITELSSGEPDENIPFIFQEANFYVNKTIDRLHVMQPSAKVIFNSGVDSSKLIDSYRLETVIRILKQVREKSYALEEKLEQNGNLSEYGIQLVKNQKESDMIYDKRMQQILSSQDIKGIIQKEIPW